MMMTLCCSFKSKLISFLVILKWDKYKESTRQQQQTTKKNIYIYTEIKIYQTNEKKTLKLATTCHDEEIDWSNQYIYPCVDHTF